MIIQCPKCQARYQYDTARFEGKPSKKIRCAKCQDVFEITNPESAPQEVAATAAPAPASAPSHDANEMTMARHQRKAPAYSYSGTPIDSPRASSGTMQTVRIPSSA